MSSFLRIFLLTSSVVLAQQPAPTNVPGAAYPRIEARNRVTFQLTAPQASKVRLVVGGRTSDAGEGGPVLLEKDERGIWSATVGPLPAGFHYYWFEVDGMTVNDPGSETFFGWGRQTSGIEIPDATGGAFYAAAPVPHGEVHIHWYHSRVTGALRRAYIYTPPGYGAGNIAYPVLYLQHGAGESERAWTAQGRANFILDNLIAAKKAVPMLIVMDNGYAARPGDTRPRVNEMFGDVLLEDLIPEIERHYRVKPGRENRALAGLSMGGGQALEVGLKHLDRFAYLGSFSGAGSRGFDAATSFGGVLSQPDRINRELKLFWMACGRGDFLSAPSLAMHQALDRLHIRHDWWEHDGVHDWQAWRMHLDRFAPLLFRN